MRHILFKILTLFFIAYSSAQNIDVSGNVQDISGVPIPGVNILIKNTTKGTVTDFDGNFKISGVSIGSTLSFSYIGYVSKEVTIQDSSKLNHNPGRRFVHFRRSRGNWLRNSNQKRSYRCC